MPLRWYTADTQQLIKVNALQVAPAELEDQLLKSEVINDAAVVGITLHDEEWPRAYVVLTEEAKQKGVTPKQIQDWFKPRVAKHKALVGGVKFIDEVVSHTSFAMTVPANCCTIAKASEREDPAKGRERLEQEGRSRDVEEL